MKKSIIILSIATVLIAFTTGCKKEETAAVGFDQNLLINNSWKVTNYTMEPNIDYNSDGIIDTDLYTYLYGSECMKSNFIVFKADFTAQANHACPGNGVTTEPMPWSFTDNNTKFIANNKTTNIVVLNEINFIISANIEAEGITYKYTITYTKL